MVKRKIKFEIGVHINNVCQWYKISRSDTFGSLKAKILAGFKEVKKEEYPMFLISLQFLSVVAKQKPVYIPLETDPVMVVIEREENAYIGQVSLSLIDLRTRKELNVNSLDNLDDLFNSPESSTKIAQNTPVSCTSWIPNSNSHHPPAHSIPNPALSIIPTNLSISESLFWEISNIAIAQGKLQKKVVINKKQEVWRDMYVILERDRLWLFSQTIAARSATAGSTVLDKEVLPPSFIPLPNSSSTQYKLMAQIVDSCVFSVIIDSQEGVHETVTFRTKSMDLAEHWVKSFYKISESIRRKQIIKKTVISNHTHGNGRTMSISERDVSMQAAELQRNMSDDEYYSLNDNDMMANIEQTITRSQLEVSEAQIKTVGFLSTFDGMLKCSYLRGYFQKFLMTNSFEEAFLFWEYVEDYRRGHPQADHAFGFVSDNRVVSESTFVCTKEQALQVSGWAENIYNAFAEACAFYEVSEGAGDDLQVIGNLIAQNKEILISSGANNSSSSSTDYPVLSCNLFEKMQLAAYRKLKYQYYPDFVKQAKYNKLLKAALNAYERSCKRLNLFSTFLKSELEPPSARGIQSPKSQAVTPKPELKKGGSGPRFPLFSLLSKGSAKESASKKVDSDSLKLADSAKGNNNEVVMHTPWRQKPLPVFDNMRLDAKNANKSRAVQRPKTGRRDFVISWMPDWWWDYVEFAPHTYAEDEAVRQKFIEDTVKAYELHQQQENDMRNSAISASRDGATSGGSGGCSDKSGEKVNNGTAMADINSNMSEGAVLQALSNNSFDRERHSESDSERSSSSSDDEAALKISFSEQYNFPNWIPINIDEVLDGMHQKTLANNKQFRAKDDLNSTVHRELLLRAQTKDLMLDTVANLGSNIDSSGRMMGSPGGVNVSVHAAMYSDHRSSLVHVEPSNSTTLLELRKSFVHTAYGNYQPLNYLQHSVPAGLGTIVLTTSIKCRYFKRKSPVVTPLNGNSSSNLNATSYSVNNSNKTINISKKVSTPVKHSSMSFSMSPAPSGVNNGGTSQSMRADPHTPSDAHMSALRDAYHGNDIHNLPVPINHNSSFYTPAVAPAKKARSLSEEFLGANYVMGVDWFKQFAMVTISLGEPYMVLFDPVTLHHTATVSLNRITKVQPTPLQLHSMDLFDALGLNWQIQIEGVDEEDTRTISKKFLELLTILTQPAVTEIVHIVKAGYLQKRGRYNKAFKQRWFVLTSDYKLRYYKDEAPNSVYKGEIVIDSTLATSDVIRFNKEIILSMKGINRTFILQADDGKEAEEWIQLLYTLIALRAQRPPSVMIGESGGVNGTIDEESEGEED